MVYKIETNSHEKEIKEVELFLSYLQLAQLGLNNGELTVSLVIPQAEKYKKLQKY